MALNNSQVYSALAPEAAETSVLVKKAAVTNPKAPHLPNIIDSYQRSWYERFDNIGGGNTGKGLSKGVNWAATILSGGALGSYALSRDGSLNKEIDRVVAEKQKVDFNASYRMTDIFTRASSKIEPLSAKVDVCDQLDGDLKEFIEQNEASIKLFDEMRKASNPGIIGRVRGGISNAWEKAKDVVLDNPGASALGATVAAEAAIIAGPTAILTGAGGVVSATASSAAAATVATASATATAAGFLGSKLGALAAASIANPAIALPVAGGVLVAAGIGIGKMIKDKHALQRNLEQLKTMRGSVQTIRAKTEAERDKLLGDVMKKFANEQQVEQNLRKLIELRAPNMLVDLEAALQEKDPKAALQKLVEDLKAANVFHDHLEIKHIENAARVLGTYRSKKLRNTVQTALLDNKDATGIEGIGRLVENLNKVNTLTGVRGKRIALTLAHETHPADFSLQSVIKEGDSTTLVLQNIHDPSSRQGLKITKKGESYEMSLVKPLEDLKDIAAELKANEANFQFSGSNGARGKALFDKAQKTFLRPEEYRELKGHIDGVPFEKPAFKCFVAISENKFEAFTEEQVKKGAIPPGGHDHELRIY